MSILRTHLLVRLVTVAALVTLASACSGAPAAPDEGPDAATRSPRDAGDTAYADAPSRASTERSKTQTERCRAGDGDACLLLGYVRHARGDGGGGHVLIESACAAGSARGCVELGVAAQRRGDMIRARALFVASCEADDPIGCNNLGTMTAKGQGGEASLEEAVSLYERSCALGSPLACANLASSLAEGRGAARDPLRADELYAMACMGGELHACMRSAWMHASQCLEPDAVSCKRDAKTLDELVGWLGATCERAPEGTQCVAYAAYLEQGRGTSPDPTRAASLYDRACSAGQAWACHGLASLMRTGRGIARDPKLAAAVYAKACDAGFAASCRVVGLMFLQGDAPLDADPERGSRALEKACASGMPRACKERLVGCAQGVALLCGER